MLTVSNDLADVLDKNTSISIFSRVVFEWEMNSYHKPIINIPDSVNDLLFPDSSIILPRRPRSGMPKMIVGIGRVVSSGSGIKYRIPSEDGIYKYYRSSDMSDTDGNIDFTCELEYNESFPTNKIVIGFEKSYGYPESILIEVRKDDEWESIGTYSPDDDGLCTAYYDESWSEEFSYSDTFDSVDGIRFSVESMIIPEDTPELWGAAVDLIQVSPRLVFDFTNRVISVDSSRDREDSTLTNPIGSAISSTATVNLANEDNIFNYASDESVLSGILENNVKIVVESMIRVGEEYEYLPKAIVYTDSYGFDTSGIVAIDGRDYSKFLQSRSMEKSFYKDMNILDIIEDIIQRAEIQDYDIRYSNNDLDNIVPFIFFDKDVTVWSALTQIAVSEQAAFYIDESGRFIWESKDYLWDDTSIDHTIKSESSVDGLANLINYSLTYNTGVNSTDVKWKNTFFNDCDTASKNNVLWEQKELLSLGASPLKTSILFDSEDFYIDVNDHLFFPPTGVVNINSEYIRYTKGEISGQMIIDERGVYGSNIIEHMIVPDTDMWSFYSLTRFLRRDGNGYLGRHYIKDSKLAMVLPQSNLYNVSHYIGGAEDDSYQIYGCELTFPYKISRDEVPVYEGDGLAGLFIHSDGDREGYYFELTTSPFSIRTGIKNPEARIWKFKEDGTEEIIAGFIPDNITTISDEEFLAKYGAPISVLPGFTYNIEVYYRPREVFIVELPGGGTEIEYGDDAELRFVVNGNDILVVNDNEFSSGKWGVFARGKTNVQFDYIYAIDRLGTYSDLTGSQRRIFDKVRGGYQTNLLSSTLESYNIPRADVIIEDFGPIVQEVKEFDIDHEVAPAIYSDLFVSNENKVFKVYHKRDQFSSRFALANKSRSFQIIAGQDPVTNTTMRVFIYGQPILRPDEGFYTVRNEDAILRNGEEKINIESEWIQTNEQARRIGDWLVDRWGNPAEVMELEIMMDPRIQIGDVIGLEVPRKSFNADEHKYHVVGIRSSVGDNNSMSLIVRRIVE